MRPTLLIIGHDNFKASVFNKALIDAVKDLPGLDLHFVGNSLDVPAEQALLLKYDRIILQSPLYWYAITAQLKNYIEKVFTFGFAYGTAYQLSGKHFMLAITAAGHASYYQPDGLNKYTIQTLTLPIERTANYCKAHFYPHVFALHNAKAPEAGGLSEEELNKKCLEYRQQVIEFMQQ